MDVSENADFTGFSRSMQRAISERLVEGERVQVVIQGASNCAIVGTDRRAFLYKRPFLYRRRFLAGATFGRKLASFDYLNISGVEVHTGAMSGAVILHVPGAESVRTSSWGNEKSDSWKAHNAIPLARPWGPAQQGAVRLRGLITEYQNGASKAAKDSWLSDGTTAAPSQSESPEILDALRQLGELRDAGVVAPEEFEAKKAELLPRM